MKLKRKAKHMTTIGGQAIIEGVMMRGPQDVGIAVRKSNGEIVTKVDKVDNITTRNKFFGMPFVRGVVALIEAMIIGTKALMFSADIMDFEEELDIEENPDTENEKKAAYAEKAVSAVSYESDLEPAADVYENKEEDSKLNLSSEGEDEPKKEGTDWMIYVTVFVSLALSVLLFMILPTAITSLFKTRVSSSLGLNLIEGVIRVSIFLAYLIGVSKVKDIKRTFQYHGAEHKTIHCYENEEELTVENVKKHPILHPRCGTSFLFMVMIISIIVFSFFGWPHPVVRIVSRILLFPLIGGISYEINKVIGRSDSILARAVSYPGLMLQKHATTIEPDDSQIEVAIRALELVRVEDKDADKW